MAYDIYNDYEFYPIDELLKPVKKPGKAGQLEEKLKELDKNIRDTGNNDSLKDILTDKITLLEEILDDLDTQVKERESLRKSILEKFDRGVCNLRTKLYEIDSWELGRNKTIDSRRSRIEQEIDNLREQKRIEERECWRDIALLKKEKRHFFQEYRNAVRRIRVIFPEKFKDKDEKTKRR